MENILIIALFFVKKFASYIILASLAFLLAVTILSFIVSIITRRSANLKRYNLYFIISLISYANGIVIESILHKKVFTSFIDLMISISVIVIVGLLGNALLSIVKFKKKDTFKGVKKIDIEKVEKPKTVEVLSCVEEPVSVYGGYIDVLYLKGLIDKIKEKNLEYDDEREIEELEIYLLNFVTRQPNAYERGKLSNYIESFFKKLAKYNVI